MGEYYYYNKENDSKEFYLESRFILFVNEEKKFNKKFFIYNQSSLDEALSIAMISDAIKISGENMKQNFNSNNNSFSQNAKNLKIEEIINKNITIIKQEKSINYSKIFSKENFDKSFYFQKISDLDFNLNIIILIFQIGELSQKMKVING